MPVADTHASLMAMSDEITHLTILGIGGETIRPKKLHQPHEEHILIPYPLCHTSAAAIVFALLQYSIIQKIPLEVSPTGDLSDLIPSEKMGLVKDMDGAEEGMKRDDAIQQNKLLVEIYEAIRTGAKAFLKSE